jgi:hypothetical protein
VSSSSFLFWVHLGFRLSLESRGGRERKERGPKGRNGCAKWVEGAERERREATCRVSTEELRSRQRGGTLERRHEPSGRL